MSILSIVSLSLLGLLVIGFLFGMFRSFKKSLTRFIMIFASLLIAIFVSPVLSSFLIKNFVSGYVFNGFGITVDFEEILQGMASDGAMNDIISAKATEDLALNLMNLVVNIAAFFVIFIALIIVTLIFYWIGSFIVFFVSRRSPKYEDNLDKKRSIPYRLGGGFFGFLSTLIFLFVLAVPVFGVMNICDQFLEKPSTETESASAYSQKYIASGQVFKTDDATIGQVESLLEQYFEIKSEIDSSALGKITNFVGIRKISASTFDYLTTVENGSLKVSLTNEIKSVIKVYNLYKEGFIENSFNVEDKDSVDKSLDVIESIYKEANNSSIIKSYMVELLPKMREKLLAGEPYLGINFDSNDEFSALLLIIIDKGFDTTNLTEINNNVYALIDVVRSANEAGLLEAVSNNADIMTILKEDETNFVKNVFVELSDSKFKEALPAVIDEMIKIVYDMIVDINDEFSRAEIDTLFEDATIPEITDWAAEGENFQKMFKDSLALMDMFGDTSNLDAVLDSIGGLGKIIDDAVNSKFSKHFKILVIDLVDNNVPADILGVEGKNFLIKKLELNWKPEFKFETLFSDLKDTLLFATGVIEDLGNIAEGGLDSIMSNLEGLADKVLGNELVADTVSSLIENANLEEYIPAEYQETIVVVKDVVANLLNPDITSKESLAQYDIPAGKEIFNIVVSSSQTGGFVLDVDPTLSAEQQEAAKVEKAEEILETIQNSNAIMTVIEKATANEQTATALQNMTETLKEQGGDVLVLTEAITNIDTSNVDPEIQAANQAKKDALMKLFGLAA